MTSLLQIFHLIIWPIFYILRKAKSIQNLRWLVLIPLHVLLFGWIVVVMDPLRVVPPCSSPVLHPPPLCCSAASPKRDAKHGHFAAQLPGTPPEKWGAAHHLPRFNWCCTWFIGLKFGPIFQINFLHERQFWDTSLTFYHHVGIFPTGILVAMEFCCLSSGLVVPEWFSTVPKSRTILRHSSQGLVFHIQMLDPIILLNQENLRK